MVTHICRICGSPQLTPIAQTPYLRRPGICHFLECQTCGTVCDAGIFQEGYGAGDNAQYTAADIKFYIEYIGSPAAFAEVILNLKQWADQRHIQDPRLLDVGTAFGFAVSFAQYVGWQAIGVEPSDFGKRGRELLHAPIVTAYLEEAALDKASFDAILVNDVIEHVTDPLAFVAAVVPYLKPDGMLVITTPNAQVISQKLEPNPVDVLSPGYHLNILSSKALAQVLRQNGLADVAVNTEGGNSGKMRLVAMAALQQNGLPKNDLQTPQDPSAHVQAYLEKLASDLESDGENSPLYGGTLFHLLEAGIRAHDYIRAAAYERKLLKLIHAQGWREEKLAELETADFASYVAQVPAYLGMLYFHHAILGSQHRKDYAAAAHAFEVAHRLFLIEQRTQIYPREGWPEQALNHKALAKQQLARPIGLAQRLRNWLAAR